MRNNLNSSYLLCSMLMSVDMNVLEYYRQHLVGDEDNAPEEPSVCSEEIDIIGYLCFLFSWAIRDMVNRGLEVNARQALYERLARMITLYSWETDYQYTAADAERDVMAGVMPYFQTWYESDFLGNADVNACTTLIIRNIGYVMISLYAEDGMPNDRIPNHDSYYRQMIDQLRWGYKRYLDEKEKESKTSKQSPSPAKLSIDL